MSEDQLFAMRHSLAHITASAVKRLWPNAKFGIGPVVENGFYYDIDIDDYKITEHDFSKIEKTMRRIIQEKQDFIKSTEPINQAIDWAKSSNQPYKLELLNDLKREGTTVFNELDSNMVGATSQPEEQAIDEVSFYTNGDFRDLCRGPHLASTDKVGKFKLIRVSGAYWRGNENNAQMQRLYGVAFLTDQELEDHLNMLEEAKKRDHRRLGRELDLYISSPLVGTGLPLFTPRGTILRDILASFSNQLRQQFGFQKVWTPNITKTDLYKKSGHWDKFGDELFLVESQETSDNFVLKPMNCPHHIQLFAANQHSYRDMPIRFLETTTDYRDEKTGELGGLSRVRALTQDDSHIFCRTDQIEQEINNLLVAANKLYSQIDMKLRVRLSYRDESDAYLGDIELWEKAQNQLKSAVIANNLEYFEQTGEAAFYGPKIDFMATDAINREHQVATIQLDFVQPARFELDYKTESGESGDVVMIHCALLGSIERFMSVFIEHTAGWFPFWAAPEQIRILTINDQTTDYVNDVIQVLQNTVLMQPVKYNELRFSVDDRSESLGKKIKEATLMKIPVQLIIGPKDRDSKVVSVRYNNNEQQIPLDQLSDFFQNIK